MKISVKVRNVVFNGAFTEGIDLNRANAVLKGSKYRHKKFPGLVFRLANPPATALLFRNGRFVCTGTKSEAEGRRAIAELLKVLQKNGLVSPNCAYQCEVQNMVASINIENASIDMERFLERFREVTYEPERFPAAIYRMKEPKVTFLVFPNGKLICSGVKSMEELNETVGDFCSRLEKEGMIYLTV